MPLTDVQIRTAKPGLRPASSGKAGKQADSKGKRTTNESILGKADLAKFVVTEKPYKLADEKGLYLEVRKVLAVQVQVPARKEDIPLGVYPQVSLANAGETRDDCRRKLAQEIGTGN